MAPIKFEENIREKLEGRDIQPSPDAWKKLSGKIDATEEQTSSKIIWCAVAASFIGILIVTSVFFSSNEKANEGNTDFVEVNTSEKEVMDMEMKGKEVVNVLKNESAVIASEEVKSGLVKNIIMPNEKKKDMIDRKSIEEKAFEDVAKVETPIQTAQEKEINNETYPSKEDVVLNAKVKEVVAQLEQLKNNNTSITIEELDALLANAQREIQSQRILSSNKVDPEALLGDVEWELEQSLRDKIYYALGDGFQSVKAAIVGRNN